MSSPWEIEPHNREGGKFHVLEPGSYPATLVQILDVGHQPDTYEGQAKWVRKLVLVFELAEEDPDEKPWVLAHQVGFSLGPKSNLRKILTSMGAAFDDGVKIDVRKFAGSPCLVGVENVQRRNSKGENRTYHQFTGASRLPKGIPAATPTLPVRCWSVLEGTPSPAEDWLPRVYGLTVEDLAEQSREVRERSRTTAPDPAPAAVGAGVSGPAAGDDDIPF
jgi:hypothetical protein